MPKFLVAHGVLGDALLFQGKAKEARTEYALLEAADDPALRHDGTMRAARSYLFEDHSLDAERALVKEGAEARKARRAAESAETFLEAARIQIERGALAEAGRGIKEATESLRRTPSATVKDAPPPAPQPSLLPPVEEMEWRRLSAELATVRAMALAALYEREAGRGARRRGGAPAQERGDPHADERVRCSRAGSPTAWATTRRRSPALEKATLAVAALRLRAHAGAQRRAPRAPARSSTSWRAAPPTTSTPRSAAPKAAAWLKAAPTTASR